MADTCTTLRSISRLAITQMSEADRAGLIAEYLIEFSGPDAIGCLSRLRTTINYRIQQLIDEKFPLRETAEAYGDVPAVHARATAGRDERQPRAFFDTAAMRGKARALRARRREDNLERAKEVLGILQGVVVAPSFGGGDQSFNAVAQRLAVLIFGEQ
ncbi:MAG: hypothetical protein ACK5LJ_09215 [Paracoccus sp. (in: a-proteobacteria)]